MSVTFKEFNNLDKLKVYEILMYHDDCEISVGDVCISDVEGRKNKEFEELKGVKMLSNQYPNILSEKFQLMAKPRSTISIDFIKQDLRSAK